MNPVFNATGRCLCGSVRFNAAEVDRQAGACHCGMCRKWGGGPLLAADCGTDVQFQGGEFIAVYESSDWAERGFCRRCGSHLFYRLKDKQQYIMPLGLFDDVEVFDLEHQIFIDKKPSFYSFSNQTRNMTEAEIFDHYQNSSEEVDRDA